MIFQYSASISRKNIGITHYRLNFKNSGISLNIHECFLKSSNSVENDYYKKQRQTCLKCRKISAKKIDKNSKSVNFISRFFSAKWHY